ncbi:MAG: ABC transporter substrate-binding protein [Oscillospiraceae bacterium]|nr:ABC transporter substrate-binding protein [Oscillospiraceae bacterium]
MKKITALMLCLLMLTGMAVCASASEAELPRNETLYFGGLQWGPIASWNPLGAPNNAMIFEQISRGTRVPVWETLYMYNPLDGALIPLLADGDYQWNDAMTEITVKIKPAAKWSDGTKVTAEDVAYTFEVNAKYMTNQGLQFAPFVAAVEAADESTVVIKSVLADGKSANPLVTLTYLMQPYVLQKAWLLAVEERNGGDAVAVLNDFADDVVGSGPYKPFFSDDTKVVAIRDDNYWGRDASMWGKLPVPKYLAHQIYPDNAAVQVAFAAGEIDVNQQFMPNVQDMWLRDGLPISTYLPEAPYHVSATMPTAWFNMNSHGLDNVAVRKAIALAVDYDSIIANAMTNQSPSFSAVPRSMMNPTDGEQATFDHEAVKHLQWAGLDIEGAKKLLDDAGIVDTDGDGWRELDGKKLEYNACCPQGWTDWMAAMEIVAAAGQAIGIDITTNFPSWEVYQTVFSAANQTEYDIFMFSPDGASPTMPWMRVRQFMSSEFIGADNNWAGNWGNYRNARADEIIAAIPQETDPDALKALYTEAVTIYLTEVPSFSLMYRPSQFHTVNESVWTGYTEAGDGNNIPPQNCLNGYAIADLYNIRLVD